MDNVTFTNSIRTLASAEYQNRIPAATKTNLLAVASMITDKTKKTIKLWNSNWKNSTCQATMKDRL